MIGHQKGLYRPRINQLWPLGPSVWTKRWQNLVQLFSPSPFQWYLSIFYLSKAILVHRVMIGPQNGQFRSNMTYKDLVCRPNISNYSVLVPYDAMIATHFHLCSGINPYIGPQWSIRNRSVNKIKCCISKWAQRIWLKTSGSAYLNYWWIFHLVPAQNLAECVISSKQGVV